MFWGGGLGWGWRHTVKDELSRPEKVAHCPDDRDFQCSCSQRLSRTTGVDDVVRTLCAVGYSRFAENRSQRGLCLTGVRLGVKVGVTQPRRANLPHCRLSRLSIPSRQYQRKRRRTFNELAASERASEVGERPTPEQGTIRGLPEQHLGEGCSTKRAATLFRPESWGASFFGCVRSFTTP